MGPKSTVTPAKEAIVAAFAKAGCARTGAMAMKPLTLVPGFEPLTSRL
jgi:hypothetical protein